VLKEKLKMSKLLLNITNIMIGTNINLQDTKIEYYMNRNDATI